MGVLKDINIEKTKEVSSMAGKNPNEGKPEPSAADRIIEARIKGEEVQAAKKGMGENQGGDNVATSIVTESMKQQKIVLDQLQQQISEAHKDLLEARKEREEAQTQLYNERISILQGQKGELDKKAEQAKEAGVPKSQIEIYREIRGELQAEIDELKKQQPQEGEKTEVQKGLSEGATIELERMRNEQARLLTQMRLEADDRKREWDIKMLELTEESQRRWAEYKDNKQFREQAASGLQDLASSIGAGMKRERAGGGGEAELEAHMTQFPCQACGTMIKIEPGDTMAKCPNEQCQAVYTIAERAE